MVLALPWLGLGALKEDMMMLMKRGDNFVLNGGMCFCCLLNWWLMTPNFVKFLENIFVPV